MPQKEGEKQLRKPAKKITIEKDIAEVKDSGEKTDKEDNRSADNETASKQKEKSEQNDEPEQKAPASGNKEAGGNQSNAGYGGQTTDSPKDNVSNPQPASVAYSPQNVVSLATAKCQAGGMITTQQNLQNHLNDGSITQEEYNEYYPYDGMEGSYYSVFVETDLNKASTIDGQRLSSEDAIAEYIASMLLLETDPVFYISYDGVYTTGGTSGAWFGMYTMPSDLSAKDQNIKVIAVSPPKLNEHDTLHIQKKYSISDNMFYISSECEHPEIVLKWIDYLFSDEGSRFASYGTEGKTYTLDKDQNPVFTDLILHNSDGLTFYQALKNYTLAPGLPSAYIDWKRELQCVPPSSAVMCDVWASTDTSYMLPVSLSFTSEERTRLSQIMANVNSCMYEYTTAFITGIKSFDNYEEYLNTLKKNKIDEAVQIYQNAYDRYLAKHSS